MSVLPKAYCMSSHLMKMKKRESSEKGDCKIFVIASPNEIDSHCYARKKMNMYDYFTWDHPGFVLFYVTAMNGTKSALNMLVGYECV